MEDLWLPFDREEALGPRPSPRPARAPSGRPTPCGTARAVGARGKCDLSLGCLVDEPGHAREQRT